MSRRLRLALLLALVAPAAHAQSWELVWADEFEVNGAPDPARWGYDIGTGSGGWGNNELQYYTDRLENARVEGGSLVIEAREEDFGGRSYTSARLVTRGTASWTYGRIEARIRLPEGQGIWPAFWMLPTDSPYGGWPTGGEIDVMEFLGHDPDTVHGTIHYGGGALGHRFTGTSYSLPSGRFPDSFHTFAVEWEPRAIRWYVDGELYQTQVSWSSGAGSYPAPFDQPFHILLNVAIGGNWPGSPDASTVFPQRMLVDYVRVYQAPTAYPTVTLDAPSTASSGSTLSLSATADDDGAVDRVEFLQGGGVIGTDDEAPYTLGLVGVADGCYLVSARAVDADGYATETAPAALTVGGGCPDGQASPFGIAPAMIPGIIEAEHFDLGGADVGYRDLGADNSGNGIRQDEGVDVAFSNDGPGFDVVDVAAREWLAYTVDVAEAGTYRVTARVRAPNGGRLRLALDGSDLFGDIDIAPAAFPTSYSTALLGETDLPAGRHVLRLDARSGGMTLNNLAFSFQGGTAPEAGPEAGDLGLRVVPNPAAGGAEIWFDLDAPCSVTVDVVDVVGRVVRSLPTTSHAAGPHALAVDLVGLAPGPYAVVLESDERRYTATMTVLR